MESQQFAYWLQGFAELNGDVPPTPEQWKSVREHLATVFNKVTKPVQYSPSQTSTPLISKLIDQLSKDKEIKPMIIC